MNNPATQCTNDLTSKVGGIVSVAGKVFEVYDQETLLDLTKEVRYPCVGIAYEGMAAVHQPGSAGLAAEVMCSIILLAGDKMAEGRGKEDKSTITDLLDQVRDAIKGSVAPTGAVWEFMVEVPVDITKKGLGYYQRWRTKVSLA